MANFTLFHSGFSEVISNNPKSFRGESPQRGFCTSWTRIWGQILGCEFLSPEYWGRILGSNFLVLCFPIKKSPLKSSPSRNSPPKIHLPKNSPQNSDWEIHIAALLQGHFAEKVRKYRSSQNYYRQSCYSREFIFPKLPLPLPSWNSDEFPLPLPSWCPQSPLHFHWLPITVLKVIWINFPKITVTVTILKCFWIRIREKLKGNN